MESLRIGQSYNFIDRDCYGRACRESPVLELTCYPASEGFIYRVRGEVQGHPSCVPTNLCSDVLVPISCMGNPLERHMLARMLRNFAEAFERGDTEDPVQEAARLKAANQALTKQLDEVRKAAAAKA